MSPVPFRSLNTTKQQFYSLQKYQTNTKFSTLFFLITGSCKSEAMLTYLSAHVLILFKYFETSYLSNQESILSMADVLTSFWTHNSHNSQNDIPPKPQILDYIFQIVFFIPL